MAEYPKEIPTLELKLLFDMITGGAEANLAKALNAGWTIQGYAQGLFWPVDGDGVSISAANVKMTDAQAVEALGVLAEGGDQAEVAGLGTFAVNQMLNLLLPILLRWLQEWLADGGFEKFLEGRN